MACDISHGRVANTCKTVGGIKAIYVWNWDDSFDVDTDFIITDDVILAKHQAHLLNYSNTKFEVVHLLTKQGNLMKRMELYFIQLQELFS